MIPARTNLELVRAAMQSHISRRKRRNALAVFTGLALTLVAAAVAMPDHDTRSTASQHSRCERSERQEAAALASEIGQAPIYQTGVAR